MPVKISQETLEVLMVIMPGFLVVEISNYLSHRAPIDFKDKVIKALIFSVIISPFATFFNSVIPEMQPGSLMGKFTGPFLGIVLGITWALNINYGTLVGFLRKIKITRETSSRSVWHNAFIENPRYVVLNFANERRLLGWPREYPIDPEESYIYLEQTSWVHKERENEDECLPEARAKGMLVNLGEVEFIEFIENEREENV